MTTPDTRQTIMLTARAMVQAHGYNALSFREIAKEVGVKSASIHYHFPTKGDLAAALARRYTEDAEAIFASLLEAHPNGEGCIAAFADIFRAALLNNNRMCLCGIMAAERDDLPAEVRAEVERFVEVCVTWIAEVLRRLGPRLTTAHKDDRALGIYAAIGGAQLMARGRGDIALYDQAIAAYRLAGLMP